jgi:hypothetical protein
MTTILSHCSFFIRSKNQLNIPFLESIVGCSAVRCLTIARVCCNPSHWQAAYKNWKDLVELGLSPSVHAHPVFSSSMEAGVCCLSSLRKLTLVFFNDLSFPRTTANTLHTLVIKNSEVDENILLGFVRLHGESLRRIHISTCGTTKPNKIVLGDIVSCTPYLESFHVQNWLNPISETILARLPASMLDVYLDFTGTLTSEGLTSACLSLLRRLSTIGMRLRFIVCAAVGRVVNQWKDVLTLASSLHINFGCRVYLGVKRSCDIGQVESATAPWAGQVISKC